MNDAARFCEKCGKKLRAGSPPELLRPTANPTAEKCRWCGLPLVPGQSICKYCLRDNAEKNSAGKMGGVLFAGGLIVIIAGLFSLAATISLMLPEIDTYAQDPANFSAYILLALCAIFAVALGFLPLRRKSFKLSLAGGIFSLIGGAFFIGVFGLILIVLGRKGFKD